MSNKEEGKCIEAVKPSVPPLNSESCLPPRKRLLVGFRGQNGCVPPLSSLSSSSSSTSWSSSSSSLSSSSSSSSSLSSSSSSLSPPSISSVSSEFNVHIRKLLYGNAWFSLSPEEMIEASRSAALAAAEIAAAAKATALEKVAAATKAAAAAKKLLDLVASTSDKALIKESYRKNKPKKQIPIKLLYKKREAGRAKGSGNSLVRKKRNPVLQDVESGESLKEVGHDKALGIHKHVDDEELALQLHRAMNSSPRILKKAMNTDSQTDCRANASDHSRVVTRKKHKGPKFASLENVRVNCDPQICKATMTSLPDGNGSVYVRSEQSTSSTENVSPAERVSNRPSNEYNYQSHKERGSHPQVEGVAGYFMTDDKQHVDTLESNSLGKASYNGPKIVVSPCNIRNSEDHSVYSLPLEFGQCRRSQVLQQEGLEPQELASAEATESQCYADRLKSEHCHKVIITPTSSEEWEPSFIGNCKKFVFPQSQCLAASKSLCSLHSNSTFTTGISSIKVDE